MIVDKNSTSVQQQERRNLQQRNLQQLAVGGGIIANNEELTDDEDDGENDEENIVIDMVDEDEDEDEDYSSTRYQQQVSTNGEDSFQQFGAISVYNNSSNNNNNNHNDQLQNQSYLKINNYEDKLLSLDMQNNNQQQQQDSSQTQSSTEPEEFHFNIGDLVWFDPNQLGYSIPGKVIDYYAGLTVLTVEGYAQPAAELALVSENAHNSQSSSNNNSCTEYGAYNKLLLEADSELQVYDLSEIQQFKTLKLRLPLSDECGMKDLVDLDELSLESIIWNLKLRYKQELVYTRCGHKILLSLNPNKQLSNVYNLDQVNKYDTINSNKLTSLTNITASIAQQQQQQSVQDETQANNSSFVSAANHLSSSLIRWLLLHDNSLSNSNSNSNGNNSDSNSTANNNIKNKINCDPAKEEPHLFGLANEALKRLLISGQDQCFVLLGESGSGKTEASKLLVQYLATVNKSPTNLMTEQILESIQVLESFGNAKTIHNDNSSRFGKLLDIRYNLNNGFIIDAKTSDLNLLDRTRIVSQAENERNYHIFYELLAGLSRNEKEKYGLQSAEKYFYLNQGHCVELNSKEDGEDFRSLLASMQVLGFNYEEQDTIFRLLASVLHLGNIYFHRKVLAVRSGKLAQQLASAGVEGVEIGSDTEVRWVSHLLQIQFDSVMRCLTVRTTDTTTSVTNGNQQQPLIQDRIITPLNIDQALDTRDAIARALYTCLFRWLIQRINAMISAESSDISDQMDIYQQQHQKEQPPIYLCRTSESLCEFQPDRLASNHLDQKSHQSSLSRSQFGTSSIGHSSTTGLLYRRLADESEPLVDISAAKTATMTILDAFGFENLAENNFEQLCINYTAELLQYHTQRYLLRLEQAEYAKERLRWEPLVTTTQQVSNGSYQSATISSSISRSIHNNQVGSTTSAVLSSSSSNNGPGAIVNLISKKPLGILNLLDDECNFPKATDQSFVEKCHHNHTLNENYQRARLEANTQEFGIRHFRQQKRTVWYQVDGFIEKNRDYLRPDIVDLLVGSKMSIVADMLRKLHKSQEQKGSGTKTLSRTYDGRYVSMKPRATTVAARFQDSLHNNRVLESINCSSGFNLSSPQQQQQQTQTQIPAETAHYYSASIQNQSQQSTLPVRPNPWFIICLKPNQSRTEQVFDVSYVQDQILSMGLLELAQIRKLGYPIRVRYGEFVRRYKCLVPQQYLNNLASCQDIQAANRRLNSANKSNSATTNNHEIKRAIRDVCSAIIEYRFSGETLSTKDRLTLKQVREQYQCGLTKMFLNEKLFYQLEQLRLLEHQQAILLIQRVIRGWLIRREYLIERRAAIVIQTQLRGWLARREFWRQYLLMIMLQRYWRRQLIIRRRKALEARRKAQRQQQQLQLQELQAQQRQHADQFRHRLQPSQLAASRRNQGSGRAAGLDIPEELAQLYRLQRNWLPVHDLTHVNEINLTDLMSREQRRRKRHKSNQMSVPFIVTMNNDNEEDLRSKQQLSDIVGSKLAQELELEDERYSLQSLIMRYYTLDVPQFGYSRLPITRSFSWFRLNQKRVLKSRKAKHNNGEEIAQFEQRLESVELKAIAIYKLILRYIDSDLNDQPTSANDTQYHSNSTNNVTIQKVIKFKLIADYIIYLCLNEPLLRDEIYLQLISQSWQNPKQKSVENVWKLMINCLCCFRPQDTELNKFLLRHANDYCCEKYWLMVLKALANNPKSCKQLKISSKRKYPPTMLEYWSNQQAIDCLALSTSCYMDDHALNGATNYQDQEQLSADELSITNHSNKTLVQIGSQTSAEELAKAVLKARQVPEANLTGWSVEVQHEGVLSEFSCRLRGDDQLLDHFSRLELLPEFAGLIDDECRQQFNWVPPPVELVANNQQSQVMSNRRSTISGADSTSTGVSRVSRRNRQVSTSEFSVPHPNPLSNHQRQSILSQRSTDSSFISSRRQSSEVDLASAARLSQNSKLNRRYVRDSNGSEYSAPAFHNDHQMQQDDSYAPLSHQGGFYHQQQHYQRPIHQQRGIVSPTESSKRMNGHRRSMSMQELQLASSALNGRYFTRSQQQQQQQQYAQPMPIPASGHYASSYVSSNSPYQRPNYTNSRNAGSLQQLTMQHHHNQQHLPSGSRRRSQTPNSMSMGGSAYGYSSSSNHAYGFPLTQQTDSFVEGERRSRLMERGPMEAAATSGSLGREDPAKHHSNRRSASSSSRVAARVGQNGPSSDYASACSDYERVGGSRGGARYATPSQASHVSAGGGKANSTQGSMSQHQSRRLSTGLVSNEGSIVQNGESYKQSVNNSSRPHNPLIERYKLATGQRTRNRRAPKNPSDLDLQNSLLPPKLQQQQQQHQQQLQQSLNPSSHYMGSSAMSDSSEAPSLASHVRGIKAPLHNADLDQYLDDLFNPVLDEAELDELSDARSLATSIRGFVTADLSNLCNAEELSKIIRGTKQQEKQDEDPASNTVKDGSRLSPTFESLLESLQGGQSQRASTSGSVADLPPSTLEAASGSMLPPEPQPTATSEVFNQLGAMNLSELKALNEQLEHQIQAAQSNRPTLDETTNIPAPPPQPTFGAPPTPDDIYSRAKTIRIGKWRWPPAEGQAIQQTGDSQQVEETSDDVVVDLDAKLMPPPMAPPVVSTAAAAAAAVTSSSISSLDQNPGGSVGKLKISSEMKAKLEQLTNSGSGSARESVAASTVGGIVSQATKSLLMSASDDAERVKDVKRLGEQRKNLLEHQLMGALQSATQTGSESTHTATGTSGGEQQQQQQLGSKVQAVKQQLAAAAGVALAQLDSGNNSQASSRRQSTIVAQPIGDERRSRILQDELGPQTRAAISQRQAFYQMSASSDQLDHLSQQQQHHQQQQVASSSAHGGSEVQLRNSDDDGETIPRPPMQPAALVALSSDNLAQHKQQNQRSSIMSSTKPAQLTRAIQMSNLNEVGQGQEVDRLYGQSIAKSMVQRQHESLLAAKATTSSTGDQWVSSSPDPKLESATGAAAAAGGSKKSRAKKSRTTSEQVATAEQQSVSKNRGKQNKSQASNKQNQKQQRHSIGQSFRSVGSMNNCAQRDQRLIDEKPTTCLVYGNVDWQIKIRKEFFMPSETYDDPLVVQLVFAQLVADVFNPRHWTRLNNKERAAIKSLMKDNSIGYAPSLPQINQMQSVKQELVRMARSFGLYFTRSYLAFNFSLIADQIQGTNSSSSSSFVVAKKHHELSGRNSMSSSRENSSSSASDSELDHHDRQVDGTSTGGGGGKLRQALRLMYRLQNANNLGSDWIDMVAVHHSGLRLVAVEQQQQQQTQTPARPPWSPSGGELATPTQLPPFGYRVLETLKYRDMTDVSQIGEQELLVSMRNGKKCWLISSEKANQLGSLLRCFHADYNDHITNSNPTSNNNSKSSAKETQFGKASVQKKKQKSVLANKNALLAYDDDHHGDHIEQRQITNRFGKLHPSSNSNNDLADSERVLSNNLATNPKKSSNKQFVVANSAETIHKLPPESSPSAAAAAAISSGTLPPIESTGGQIELEPEEKATSISSKGRNKSKLNTNSVKKNLWQNSLSRMSNKFSIFGGGSGSVGGSQSRGSRTKSQNKTAAGATCSASVSSTSIAPQVALDGWIETKVDFEEDEEDNNENNNNNNNNSNLEPLDKSQVSMQLEEHERQQQQQQQQQLEENLQNGDEKKQIAQQQQTEQTSDTNNNNNNKSEDGKYSLLQFALYNFREAIDKYSLESRASKAPAQAGDTSTLRGSLKLIESLRNNTKGSGDGSKDGAQSQHGTKERKSNGRGRIPLVIGSHSGTIGGAGSSSNDWTWRELAEMVKFTPVPIRQSLLKLPSDELNKRALDCFLAIMQYMGDAPTTGTTSSKHSQQQQQQLPIQGGEVECVYLILMNCHNYPILRDEIYCQLMKQTTSNRSPKADSCLRGWRLFSIVAAYFDCSPSFKPYLLKYLETAAYDKRRAYCSVAALCLQNLRKTFKYNGRKNVPSIEEIAATSAGRNSKRQIYRLPGGTERVINTKSTTVVEDIIHEICSNMLNVSEPDEMLEFSLYCIADGDLYTMPLNRDEYILDITTELIKNHQQYFLIFCRSIWYYPLRLDSKLYIEVIFNQIAPDYLEGLLLVLPSTSHTGSSRRDRSHNLDSHRSAAAAAAAAQPLRLKTKLVKEVARIAALLHRASGTDYMPHKDEVKYLLPKPIISAMKQYQRSTSSSDGQQKLTTSSGASSTSGSSSSARNGDGGGSSGARSMDRDSNYQLDTVITTPSKWVELVQNNWREMSAFDTLDAKAQFLDIIRHWPLFGSSFFAIKFIQRDLIQPMDYILALNKLGIQMLDMSTHETIHKYPFNEVISTRKVRSEDGALFLDLKCGNLMKRTIIRIQTDQAHEISRLIRQYIDIELLQQKQLQQQQQQLISSPKQPPSQSVTKVDGDVEVGDQLITTNDLHSMPKANDE